MRRYIEKQGVAIKLSNIISYRGYISDEREVKTNKEPLVLPKGMFLQIL